MVVGFYLIEGDAQLVGEEFVSVKFGSKNPDGAGDGDRLGKDTVRITRNPVPAAGRQGAPRGGRRRDQRRRGWLLDLIIGNREMAAGRRLAAGTQARRDADDLRRPGKDARPVARSRLPARPTPLSGRGEHAEEGLQAPPGHRRPRRHRRRDEGPGADQHREPRQHRGELVGHRGRARQHDGLRQRTPETGANAERLTGTTTHRRSDRTRHSPGGECATRSVDTSRRDPGCEM